MTTTTFAAVLFSAGIQGSWNFLAKRSHTDKISLLASGWLLFGLLLLPVALLITPLREFRSAWTPFIAASAILHGAYICCLGRAYSLGEISVVYPVARGFGVAGTVLLSLIFGLHPMPILGCLGIGSIMFGTLLIGLKELPLRERAPAFISAIMVGACISGYSVVDSMGARTVPGVLYLATMNLGAALFAAPFLLRRRRIELQRVWEAHKAEALLIALSGSLAYGIVLWAFRESPVSYVAALRELSVVVAAGLGVLTLNEGYGRRKIAGIALILGGAVLIRLL